MHVANQLGNFHKKLEYFLYHNLDLYTCTHCINVFTPNKTLQCFSTVKHRPSPCHTRAYVSLRFSNPKSDSRDSKWTRPDALFLVPKCGSIQDAPLLPIITVIFISIGWLFCNSTVSQAEVTQSRVRKAVVFLGILKPHGTWARIARPPAGIRTGYSLMRVKRVTTMPTCTVYHTCEERLMHQYYNHGTW